MQINQKKLERQQIFVDKWFNSSKHGSTKDRQGTGCLVTGFGKTYCAVLIIKRLLRINPKNSIVLIVPANVLDQWTNILSEHLTKKQLNVINVFTPNYIVNNKIKIQTKTLIVDELHECYSDEHIKVIDGTYIRTEDRLALTATYEDSKDRHELIKHLFPVIDEITEEEGIREGYVSPYIEFNLSVELNEEEREAYDRYSEIIGKNLSKFGGSLDIAIKCIGGGIHEGRKWTAAQIVFGYAASKGWKKDLDLTVASYAQINDIWNPHKIFGYATHLMGAIRHRKNLLHNCSAKTDMCLALSFKFPSIKAIIFSQSTAFADKLNLLLNEQSHDSSVVYHSAVETTYLPSEKTGKLIKFGPTRLKRRAIARIATGVATRLCTASSLDKGLDIPDLGMGITASGTSNFTQYKQRKGRTGRKDLFNPNKTALIINLFAKDTKDEVWLRKRQSKTNHKIHTIHRIEDVRFDYVEADDININEI